MLEYLPSDWRQAILVGRILTRDGPTPVVVAEGRVRDVSRHAATVSQLLNGWNGDIPPGPDLGPLESFGFTRQFAEPKETRLLSPFDLQCIKASGVTFAVSAIERVIEERCRGDASKAESLRASLRDRIGADIRSVKPGSGNAMKLKQALIADGLWSQYLEVAIGPDAQPTVSALASYLEGGGVNDVVVRRKRSPTGHGESETVAIVGMAGRFPGAPSVEALWEVLRDGRDATTEIAPEDLDPSIPAADRNDPSYVRRRGILPDPAAFDAAFFG